MDDVMVSDVTFPRSSEDGAAGEVMLRSTDGRVRLVLTGEIDASLAPRLSSATAEALARELPIDIHTRSVTFMDSSALTYLARMASTYQPRRLTFVDPSDVVLFLLDVTKVGDVVEVVERDRGMAGQ
ncbi:hypothetical protein GCM10023169_33860 [Georgenia halophila]|uniref:STAS domain-containing protein n=1 Tax=Georgenia halophila TaxID=620889 RepID=A0ABP8LKF0_9MICO